MTPITKVTGESPEGVLRSHEAIPSEGCVFGAKLNVWLDCGRVGGVMLCKSGNALNITNTMRDQGAPQPTHNDGV